MAEENTIVNTTMALLTENFTRYGVISISEIILISVFEEESEKTIRRYRMDMNTSSSWSISSVRKDIPIYAGRANYVMARG